MLIEIFIYGAIYTFIGILAGLTAGVLGVGGGVVVVPGLALVFNLIGLIPEAIIMRAAGGTSLAIMIFTSLASLVTHFKLGKILWSVFKNLGPGLLAGTVMGAVIAQLIPTYWLKILFVLFLFGVAVKMMIDDSETRLQRYPNKWASSLVSFLIGLKSGLLGVGGGILIIPWLTYCGVEVRKIAAVSNLCTLTVGFAGACIFIITGQPEMAAIPYASGYVYWPAVVCVAIPGSLVAPFAARLNYRLPVKQLKYIFIVILLLTAITLLF